ncbi:hypothetical protein Nepgr_031271 [Nepenthes gracilis]|uniref:Uncharacterized protein n=1 Tax=Nepenthes gracilis TaxID=150966 RepID=A0AAD3Y504_NEPGR|nr:hypothetical protein Nepgr_031271 [Nepenthes gracilis]
MAKIKQSCWIPTSCKSLVQPKSGWSYLLSCSASLNSDLSLLNLAAAVAIAAVPNASLPSLVPSAPVDSNDMRSPSLLVVNLIQTLVSANWGYAALLGPIEGSRERMEDGFVGAMGLPVAVLGWESSSATPPVSLKPVDNKFQVIVCGPGVNPSANEGVFYAPSEVASRGVDRWKIHNRELCVTAHWYYCIIFNSCAECAPGGSTGCGGVAAVQYRGVMVLSEVAARCWGTIAVALCFCCD